MFCNNNKKKSETCHKHLFCIKTNLKCYYDIFVGMVSWYFYISILLFQTDSFQWTKNCFIENNYLKYAVYETIICSYIFHVFFFLSLAFLLQHIRYDIPNDSTFTVLLKLLHIFYVWMLSVMNTLTNLFLIYYGEWCAYWCYHTLSVKNWLWVKLIGIFSSVQSICWLFECWHQHWTFALIWKHAFLENLEWSAYKSYDSVSIRK